MFKNVIKKFRTEIILFLSCFLLYFILGTILSYYLDTANFWNVLFDLDTPRVLGDLSIIDFNHYRTAVHPLFVICFQPIVLILNKIILNPVIVIVLIQSIVSSISLVSLYVILNKIGLNKVTSICLSIIFGVSFGQIIFSASIETYIFAQFFLMLMWLFAAFKMDKKFNYWDYIIIVVLGIGSVAVTLTNFIQFLIVMLFMVFLNKNINKRWITGLLIIFCAGALSVFFAEVQNIIWPSAPNFFSKNVTDFIYGTSEENLYISTDIGIRSVLNVINATFAYSFNIADFIIPDGGAYLTFKTSLINSLISVICVIAFAIVNLVFVIKTKFNIKKHKFYYALILTYLFNAVLHLFYGNSISFIYVCHFNFIIILILGYLLNYFKLRYRKKNIILIIITSLLVILSFKNIIIMFLELFPLYNYVEHFRLIPVLIICLIIISIVLICIKNKYIKASTIILILISSFTFWIQINKETNLCKENCSELEKYEISLKKYETQLKDMKNTFSVSNFSDRDEPIGIYYFGMADRRKILYKDGKLIDMKTKEIIKRIDYERELIIPNEYTVILEDNNKNTYKIYENEDGVFLSMNENTEILVQGNKKIILPEFDTYKYSEILKVLHQEILFNIDGDIPKPNFIGYNEAWYRDTMVATMVLEETGNVKLLENWLKNVTSIYDYSRSKDIKETDNLGELLYIIGAVGIEKNELVDEILKEIQNIKKEDGTIGGNIDGFYQSYYPTALALNGAKKLNINLDLTLPKYDDGYAKLTWFYDKTLDTKTATISKLYPYINWGFYNYSGYGSLYILDEIYPLSYEAGDTSTPGKVEAACFISNYYCNQKLHISHMWAASEMFLYLKNY